MSALLTELGNLLFVVAGVYAFFNIRQWTRESKLTPQSIEFLKAVSLMGLAVAVRVGWWALAIDLAPSGANYHQWFIDNRAPMTLITAGMFLFGVVKFMGDIEGAPKTHRFKIMVASVLAAATIALF